MAILSVGSMTRNSALVLSRYTSVESSGIRDLSTSANPAIKQAMREVGGSTIASSSEATFPVDISDKVGFLVGWYATDVSTCDYYLRIHKGERWRGDVGNYDFRLTKTATGTTGATQLKAMVGPFECARFALVSTSTSETGALVGQHYMKVSFVSEASSDGESCAIQLKPFKFPTVDYDT